MVATRRGARTAPVEEPAAGEAVLTLRKKPVRKATAPKAPPAVAKPATLRGTRSRKAVVVEAGAETVEDAAPVKEVEVPAKHAGRAKKPTPAESRPPSDTVIEAERDVDATRTAASRARRPITSQRTRTIAPPEPEIEAPARATRQRKSKADAPKPLSPKKITQVNATRSRSTTASTDAKTKAQAKSRAPVTTRRRNVSDENEGVPASHPVIDLDGDVDFVEPAAPMARKASPAKQSPQKVVEQVEESEASMSSRPTTPSDSPAPVFRQPVDYTEDEVDGAVSDVEDHDDAAQDSASEDELCGPKTPMKRAAGGTSIRFYHSAQKPRNDPAPLASTARTVTRRTAPIEAVTQSSPPVSPQHDMSDALDEAITEHEMPGSHGDALVPGPDVETSHHEQLSGQDDLNETIVINDGEADSSLTTLSSTPQAPAPTHDFYIAPSVPSSISQTLSAPMATYDSDDSVLITPVRAQSQADSDDDDLGDGSAECRSELGEASSASAEPETIPWENLRQDTTIPVNFDLHFADVRSPAALHPSDLHESPLDMSDMRASRFDAARSHPTANAGPDLTVNLNDFIDFGALAEPTLRIEVPPPAPIEDGSDYESEKEEEVDWFAHEASYAEQEDREESEAECDVDEVTVVITRKAVVPTIDESLVDTSQRDIGHEGEQSFDCAADSIAPQAAEIAHGGVVDSVPDPAQGSDEDIPHYALPTVAFNARRKSLPAFGQHTPVKAGSRPNTSDGASIARVVRPFEQPWWTHSRRQSTSSGIAITPVRAFASKPASTPNAGQDDDIHSTLSSTAKRASQQTPRERFPRLAPQDNYERHAQTTAGPTRYQTPVQKSTPRAATARRPATDSKSATPAAPLGTPSATPRARFPRLAAKEVPMSSQATPVKPALDVIDVVADAAQPSSPVAASATLSATATPAATPRPRFPRLAAKNSYSEHAATVSAVSRFRTPTQASLKRPATALKAQHTPMKTPLKPAALPTPARAAMTPHPSAPLRSTMILVEIFTLDGASASAPFIALLHRLGARTTKAWSDRVTHVVFKDGSPTTLQRVRLHNKDVEAKGKGTKVHCVNSRWVSDCEAEGSRCDETDEAYAVDVTEVPRGGNRRRKSMEPSALINIGGNVVKNRKSSIGGRSSGGRSSFGRSPLKALTFESPVKGTIEKENVETEEEVDEPATPAYLAAPDKLVQMTAPMKRVKRLELNAGQGRRLTSLWEAKD